jgi:hypothetical protein
MLDMLDKVATAPNNSLITARSTGTVKPGNMPYPQFRAQEKAA